MPDESPRGRSVLKASLALFVLGYSCALMQIPLHLDVAGFGAGYENATVARSLAASGEFRDPFSAPTGPTAHVAPLYPWVLALVFKIFRTPAPTVIVLLLLNAFLLGVVPALLPVLSREVYGTARAGVAGGVLIALCGRVMPQNEGAISAVLLLGSAIAIFSRGAVSSAMLAGASMLANPSSTIALAVLAIRRGWRFLALGGALAFLICVPWIARNWMQLGSPYFIRDNFGLEVYLANNDGAQAEMVMNPALGSLHPTYNREEAELVASMGEGAYNRAKLSAAMLWIRTHPWRFLELCAQRIVFYWFPSPREGWPAYGASIVTVLAMAGLWLSRRIGPALWLGAAALVYSAPFVFIQVDVKYAFPMQWAPALLAGYAVSALLARWLPGLYSQRS